MDITKFTLRSLYSRDSVSKLSKALKIPELLISHEDTARIHTKDLYNVLSDCEFEERSFITDPFLIPDIPTQATMLFVPALLANCPVLPDGSRSKMFVFRGFWNVSRDTSYSGTKYDWDMMSSLARTRITQFYGGKNRYTRVDLRESYITRYKLVKIYVSFPSRLRANISQPPKDDDPMELHIGDEEGYDRVQIYSDSSEGVTGSSL
ncbi:hypothetical protein J3R30DRAFT_733205 [Lentinula aciculospora]|uniref:Uncharacterized protein n=1 Tax=Lentinula aciculospora TaxID=153920 RepID=A0A9W9A567_9AGAR|nr:hypothetical protein J3R30DRAFT_733205 [Lentinula aciculospora]